MKHIISFIALAIFSTNIAFGQYQFTHNQDIACTPIKNQQNTGTCWSFATTSFVESELIRLGHKNLNISEMFVVRNIYKDKAANYIFRQGKANFSQGSLAHDVIRAIAKHGILPESSYSGRTKEGQAYDHSELEAGLKGYLDAVKSTNRPSPQWPSVVSAILDVYLGTYKADFSINGKTFNPIQYRDYLKFDAKNYVSLTSFNHHPFYENFILEIPDNYSNGGFYNLPIDELMSTIDHALDNGYTIAWDGDVSEKGFSSRNGIAILPKDASRDDLFTQVGPEEDVDQATRQTSFENYSTTDDHLMHIVGTSLDQNGNKYYIIKNSWGETGPYKGFLHMSRAYMKAKTVGILLNKDSLPQNVLKKMNGR